MNKKFLVALLVLGMMAFGFATPSHAEKITVEGSTTVLPIAQKAAEVFMDNHPDADISIRGGGSGVGIASLLDGTCTIADSSRPIKDSELEKGVVRGVDVRANVVAMDGIAVIVHPNNKVSTLSKNQLKDIYTGKISNWSQVGGIDQKIVVISRDTSSGTYEAFGEMALNKEKVRSDALMQASNQAIASTVAQTPGAIGYVGLGYITNSVKTVEYQGMTATRENVLSGKYGISRPLFMYTNGAPKGLAKEFIDFILSPQGQKLVEEEGFVSLQ